MCIAEKYRMFIYSLLLLFICGTGCEKSGEQTNEVTHEKVNVADTQQKTVLPDSSLKFGEQVGLVVHFDQGETLDHLQNLLDLGVKWVRDSEAWHVVESQPGQYAFPDRFKQRLEFYRKHDIGILYLLIYENPVAYPDNPVDAEAYGRYAAAVARLLKEWGGAFVLEIWNEPHNFYLGPTLGGNWNAAPPSPWVDHYLKMVHNVVKEVKAFDPQIKLLIDEDVWVAHYWFLEHGVPAEIDGAAIHPYVHGPTLGPEISQMSFNEEFNKPFRVIDEDRSFRSIIRLLRKQYEDKLGHTPELWVTEWGYRIGQDVAGGEKVTEEIAAAFLPRVFINSVAAGIRTAMWHVSQDMGDGPWGLFQNNLQKRRTYDAYKVMTKQLGDYKLIRQIAGADQPTAGVQAYLFQGPMGYKVAAWLMEGQQEVLIQTNSSVPLRVIDFLGNTVEFYYSDQGPAAVTLSRGPLYISGVLDDCIIK
jgi:hypothetical protein